MPGDVTPAWGDGLPAWATDLVALLSAGQAWPEASETALWELSRHLRELEAGLGRAAADHAAAGDLVVGGWDGEAALAFEQLMRELVRDPGSGVLALAETAAAYAQQADDYGRETQYTKQSINGAFWVTVSAVAAALIAASLSLGVAAGAVGPLALAGRSAILQLMARLGAAAGRDYGARAVGGIVARPFVGRRTAEVAEETTEELNNDLWGQRGQAWDWRRTAAAALGGAVGGLIGMQLAAPLTSALTSRLPITRTLVRWGSDAGGTPIRGIVPAFARFPGRALNTGLSNVITSPAASIVANAVVYQQFALPTGSDLLGAFLGGAGRTNTISPFNPAVAVAISDPVGALARMHAAARAGVPFNPATISESFPFVPLPGGTGAPPVSPAAAGPARGADPAVGAPSAPGAPDPAASGPGGTAVGAAGTKPAPGPGAVDPGAVGPGPGRPGAADPGGTDPGGRPGTGSAATPGAGGPDTRTPGAGRPDPAAPTGQPSTADPGTPGAVPDTGRPSTADHRPPGAVPDAGRPFTADSRMPGAGASSAADPTGAGPAATPGGPDGSGAGGSPAGTADPSGPAGPPAGGPDGSTADGTPPAAGPDGTVTGHDTEADTSTGAGAVAGDGTATGDGTTTEHDTTAGDDTAAGRPTADPFDLTALPGQTSSIARAGMVDREIDAQVRAAAEAAGLAVLASLGGGRYQLRRPATDTDPERTFVLTARAGALAAPESTLAGGEVDAGTVDVTVSEQALRRSVGRALAHQLGVAAEQLAPVPAAVPTVVEAGRAAELRYVEQRMAVAGRLARLDDVLDLPLLRRAVEATRPVLMEVAGSWAPGSAHHGEAAQPRPVEVAAELAGIFTDDPVELARATGLRYRTVEGRLFWVTEDGRQFAVTWEVVSAAELGPPTVVAGVSRRPFATSTVVPASRVGRTGNTVHIRVSDQARLPFPGRDVTGRDPLWVHDVLRAAAHELTEAAAVLDGAPPGRDALTPDRAASGRELSPWELTGHDRGRLAEVAVLLRSTRDPALRHRAGTELTLLLDDLIGVPVTLDPETGLVTIAGRPVQDPVLPDLAAARDVQERAAVLNRMMRQIPPAMLDVAVARHLVRLAAARASATATPVGGRWLVLTVDGHQVAIDLRPPAPPPGQVQPPGPGLRELPLPADWTVERVLRLTVPPAGTDEPEVLRRVERAVAVAVAVDGVLFDPDDAVRWYWRSWARRIAVDAVGQLAARGRIGPVRSESFGEGLALLTLADGTELTLEVVPGLPRRSGRVRVEVTGTVLTITVPTTADHALGLPEPMARALADALDTLPGPSAAAPDPGRTLLHEVATTLAADMQWRPDGAIRMTGDDGTRRDIPADRVEAIAAELTRGLAAGVDLEQLRAAAADQLGRELITDSWVPGSAAHGESAPRPRHDDVVAEVAGILTDDPAELALAAGLRYRVEDGRVRWITEDGREFEVEDWAVVPAEEVGPATEVGGVARLPTAAADVDVHRRTVRIRVSDRARLPFLGRNVARPDPLWVRDVFRAVTHELTEAAARIDRGDRPEPLDQLTADNAATGRPLDPGRLSGHDRARLAEIGVLLEAARDPGLRARANEELALLLDHLFGIALSVDPETGELETGPYDLTPLESDVSAAAGLAGRVAAVNVLVGQVAGALTEQTRAWRLVADAARRRGARATRVGGGRIVLTVPGHQVAIHLHPAEPAPGAAEPLPAAELAPDGVRVLTLPPAGTPEPELARIVERAVAGAVAAMAGAPPGPGLLAAAGPPVGPGGPPVSTADAALLGDLVAAARSSAAGTGPTAAELRRLVAAAGLGFDQPGGELRHLALLAAGLLPADMAAVLAGLPDARRQRWRRRLRDLAAPAALALGEGRGAVPVRVRPIGDGLLRVELGPDGPQVTVQVVPGSPPGGGRLAVDVAGSVVTVTASPDLSPDRLVEPLAGALAEALLGALAAPVPPAGPVGAAAGDAMLHEVATLLAADALWMPAGGLLLAGPDGVRREVPADRVRTMADELSRNLADGMDRERVRATAAALLGREAAERAGRAAVDGALDALGQLADAGADGATVGKAAAVRYGAPEDGTGTSDGARRLLRRAHGGPAPAGVDEYAALRLSGLAELAREATEAARLLARLAATGGTGEGAPAIATIADHIEQLDRLLAQARNDLKDRALAARHRARVARDAAAAAGRAAEEAAGQRDRGAPERRRQALAEQELQLDTQARHLRIKAAYDAAARRATEATEQNRALLRTLAELAHEPGRAGVVDRLHSAVTDAGRAFWRYQQALLRALPLPEALVGGTPTGVLPQLDELAATLNDRLAELGVAYRVTAAALGWQLKAQWSRVASGDGVVLAAGTGPGAAEVRVRLDLDDPVEVLDSPTEHSQSMSGAFPSGGRTASTAVNRNLTASVRVPRLLQLVRSYLPGADQLISELVGALPDAVPGAAAAKLALTYGVFDARLGRGSQRSRTTAAAGVALGGGVDDNRGGATLFDVAARWRVQVATATEPAGPDWTPVEPAADGDGRPVTVRLQVPHSYTEHGPARTSSRYGPRRLPPAGAPLPEHAVTGLTGLAELYLRVAATPGPARTAVGSVAREQLRILLTEELPKRLAEAVNDPRGLPPVVLTEGGRAFAEVRVRARVVREPARSVRMVGTASVKHHLERLRIGFSLATSRAGRGLLRSWDGRLGMTAPGDGPAAATGTVGLGGGRGWPRETSVGANAIHPSVRRWTGRTQGYRLRLEYDVTVHPLGQAAPDPPVTGTGEGLFRFAVPAAYRYGLPVDAAAVGAGDPETARLRDDPDPGPPPGRQGRLPRWLRAGTWGMRGAGPASVQDLTGLDQVQEEVLRQLAEEGWVPRVEDGVTVHAADPVDRDSQLANLSRVLEQLSAARLETGYDQAAQDGVLVDLVRHRTGRPPEHRTLRVRLRPDPAAARYLGHTPAEMVVNLDIGSEMVSRSRTEAVPLRGSVRAGTEHQVEGDPGTTSVSGDAGGGRTRSASWSVDDTVNQVRLVESMTPAAIFEIPHAIVVDELRADESGTEDWHELARGRGTAEILLPTDLLPAADEQPEPAEAAPDETAPAPATNGTPKPESKTDRLARRAREERERALERALAPLLVRATWLHADLGPVLDGIRRVLPLGSRAGLAHFARFADVRSILAHPELTALQYETSIEVWGARRDPDSGERTPAPTESALGIRVRPRELTWVGPAALVLGDINLTLSGTSTRFATQGALGADVNAGPDAVDGSGAVSVSASSGTSQRQGSIAGEESLGISVGNQYVFLMRVDTDLTGAEFGPIRATRLADGRVLVSFAEREALGWYVDGLLDLPLDQVADAVTRILDGTLALDGGLAADLLVKYLGQVSPAADDPVWARLTDWVGTNHPDLIGHLRMPIAGPIAVTALLDHVSAVLGVAVPVDLAEHLERSGQSAIERVDLHSGPGRPVPDLADAVLEVLDGVAPDVQMRRPLVRRAVRGMIGGGQRWWGRLREMTEPDGYLLLDEDVDGDRISVVLRAELATGRSVLLGRDSQSMLLKQVYLYQVDSAGESTSWSTGGRAAPPLGPLGAAMATDRSHSAASTVTRVLTLLQRIASFGGVDRVRHPVAVTIEARRTVGWRRPASAIARLAEQGDRTIVSRRRLVGDAIRQVPPGLAVPAKTGARHLPVRYADPRQGGLPDRFYTEDTDIDDHLRHVIRWQLGSPALLGDGDGVRDAHLLLERQLSALAHGASLRFVHSEGGHRLVHVPVPGHPDQVAEVWIAARVSENQDVVRGRAIVEIGDIARVEHTRTDSADRSLLVPLSWNLDLGVVTFGTGEQASAGDAVTAGGRLELTSNEKGTVGTGKVRLDLDITVRRVRLRPHRPAEVVVEPAGGQRRDRRGVHHRLPDRPRRDGGPAGGRHPPRPRRLAARPPVDRPGDGAGRAVPGAGTGPAAVGRSGRGRGVALQRVPGDGREGAGARPGGRPAGHRDPGPGRGDPGVPVPGADPHPAAGPGARHDDPRGCHRCRRGSAAVPGRPERPAGQPGRRRRLRGRARARAVPPAGASRPAGRPGRQRPAGSAGRAAGPPPVLPRDPERPADVLRADPGEAARAQRADHDRGAGPHAGTRVQRRRPGPRWHLPGAVPRHRPHRHGRPGAGLRVARHRRDGAAGRGRGRDRG